MKEVRAGGKEEGMHAQWYRGCLPLLPAHPRGLLGVGLLCSATKILAVVTKGPRLVLSCHSL